MCYNTFMIDKEMEVAINAKIEMTDTCWIWHGTMNNTSDPRYTTSRKSKNINIQIRRYIYETLIGEIPDARLAKPDCGNVKCVNPEHTRIDTMSKHILSGVGPRRRKEQCASITHCPQGHEYAGYNLITGFTYKKIVFKDGRVEKRPYPSRWCRTCMNTRNQESRMRKSQSVHKLSV